MLPTNHHRLASSEIERLMYINNSPLHKLLFEREEPGIYDLTEFDLEELKLKVPNSAVCIHKDFIQTKVSAEELAGINRKLYANQKLLIDEIRKLNIELGYLDKNASDSAARELTPILQPTSREE